MLKYIGKRMFLMIPMLLGITIITFTVIHLPPGSPTELATDLNPKAGAEARERLIAYYGLDKPLHVQYLNWLKRLVTLDFGQSFMPDGKPVIQKIKERISITIQINVLSMVVIMSMALPLGVIAAVKKDSFFDKSTTVFVFVGFATPTFWLALLCMIFFGVKLGWLPISGINSLDYDRLSVLGKIADRSRHLIMPVFLGAFGGLAGLSRYMRSNMLEVVRQDYINTARAKGLPEKRVIYRHALRNALLPVITILGLSVPSLIGGAVIFETIFAIPGMGRLFYQGVLSRDYPLVMGILVIGAVLTLLGNLLADVGYALADPRIREESA